MKHIHLNAVDSTNLHAHSAALATRPLQPIAVSADTQTAGLGRAGRAWTSPPGGVWLSIAWPARQPLPHYAALPLAIGAAARDTVAALYDLPITIKWPNDLLLHNAKLAGILCQAHTAPDLLVVGLGVNANLDPAALGPHLRHPATALRQHLPHAVDLPALTRALIQSLHDALLAYDSDGIAPFLPALRTHLAWCGQAVTVSDAHGTIHAGTLAGIADSGALLLQTQNHPAPLALDVGDVALSVRQHGMPYQDVSSHG